MQLHIAITRLNGQYHIEIYLLTDDANQALGPGRDCLVLLAELKKGRVTKGTGPLIQQYGQEYAPGLRRYLYHPDLHPIPESEVPEIVLTQPQVAALHNSIASWHRVYVTPGYVANLKPIVVDNFDKQQANGYVANLKAMVGGSVDQQQAKAAQRGRHNLVLLAGWAIAAAISAFLVFKLGLL